jgi:hypothetical protein
MPAPDIVVVRAALWKTPSRYCGDLRTRSVGVVRAPTATGTSRNIQNSAPNNPAPAINHRRIAIPPPSPVEHPQQPEWHDKPR